MKNLFPPHLRHWRRPTPIAYCSMDYLWASPLATWSTKGTVDFVLRIEKSEQQIFLLSLQQGSKLLHALFCSGHGICQNETRSDVPFAGCNFPEVQIFQGVSYVCRLLFSDTTYRRKKSRARRRIIKQFVFPCGHLFC